MGERYRTDKMGNKADPCPIPTSTLKNGEEKLFHKYWIFLPTKQLEKNNKILGLNLALSKINRRR